MKDNERRHDMTTEYYPDPVSLEQFLEDMKDSIGGFEKNAASLRKGARVGEFWNGKHFMEEWFEVFGRWSEIQSEGFNPFLPKGESDANVIKQLSAENKRLRKIEIDHE
jgi:hypothetical protein